MSANASAAPSPKWTPMARRNRAVDATTNVANAIRAAICPAILVSALSMSASNPDALSGHTTAASTAAPRKVRGTTPGNSW